MSFKSAVAEQVYAKVWLLIDWLWIDVVPCKIITESADNQLSAFGCNAGGNRGQ